MRAIIIFLALILNLTAVAQEYKLELASKKGASTNLNRVEKLNPSWNYTWGPYIQEDQPSGVDFFPMFWSSLKDTVALHTVRSYVKQGRVKAVLGFNEPEAKEQGNVSVEKALEQWPMLMSLGVALGSPATKNPLNQWMKDFMAGAKERNLRVDFVCVHTYPGGSSAEGTKRLLENTWKEYGKPILFTEFGVADWNSRTDPKDNSFSPEHSMNYMKSILPWLEEQDYILGYNWFPFQTTSPWGTPSALFDPEGNLTELGKFYSNF